MVGTKFLHGILAAGALALSLSCGSPMRSVAAPPPPAAPAAEPTPVAERAHWTGLAYPPAAEVAQARWTLSSGDLLLDEADVLWSVAPDGSFRQSGLPPAPLERWNLVNADVPAETFLAASTTTGQLLLAQPPAGPWSPITLPTEVGPVELLGTYGGALTLRTPQGVAVAVLRATPPAQSSAPSSRQAPEPAVDLHWLPRRPGRSVLDARVGADGVGLVLYSPQQVVSVTGFGAASAPLDAPGLRVTELRVAGQEILLLPGSSADVFARSWRRGSATLQRAMAGNFDASRGEDPSSSYGAESAAVKRALATGAALRWPVTSATLNRSSTLNVQEDVVTDDASTLGAPLLTGELGGAFHVEKSWGPFLVCADPGAAVPVHGFGLRARACGNGVEVLNSSGKRWTLPGPFPEVKILGFVTPEALLLLQGKELFLASWSTGAPALLSLGEVALPDSVRVVSARGTDLPETVWLKGPWQGFFSFPLAKAVAAAAASSQRPAGPTAAPPRPGAPTALPSAQPPGSAPAPQRPTVLPLTDRRFHDPSQTPLKVGTDGSLLLFVPGSAHDQLWRISPEHVATAAPSPMDDPAPTDQVPSDSARGHQWAVSVNAEGKGLLVHLPTGQAWQSLDGGDHWSAAQGLGRPLPPGSRVLCARSRCEVAGLWLRQGWDAEPAAAAPENGKPQASDARASRAPTAPTASTLSCSVTGPLAPLPEGLSWKDVTRLSFGTGEFAWAASVRRQEPPRPEAEALGLPGAPTHIEVLWAGTDGTVRRRHLGSWYGFEGPGDAELALGAGLLTVWSTPLTPDDQGMTGQREARATFWGSPKAAPVLLPGSFGEFGYWNIGFSALGPTTWVTTTGVATVDRRSRELWWVSATGKRTSRPWPGEAPLAWEAPTDSAAPPPSLLADQAGVWWAVQDVGRELELVRLDPRGAQQSAHWAKRMHGEQGTGLLETSRGMEVVLVEETSDGRLGLFRYLVGADLQLGEGTLIAQGAPGPEPGPGSLDLPLCEGEELPRGILETLSPEVTLALGTASATVRLRRQLRFDERTACVLSVSAESRKSEFGLTEHRLSLRGNAPSWLWTLGQGLEPVACHWGSR